MRWKVEIIVLVLYTYFNLKLLWPLLREENFIFAISTQHGGAPNYTAVVLGLFLNAALWLWWLRREREEATH